MDRIKNTNEIEVRIRTFYKEQIIKLDIDNDKFKESEKILDELLYIYNGEFKQWVERHKKMISALKSSTYLESKG